jgi:Rrf2 family protein
MQLTTKGRYAVMAMYRLYSQLSHQQVVPISYISETEGISVTYLEHLFVELRKAGLVNAVRGMNGGYALAKDAKEIYLSDIILASEENLRFTRCSPLAHRHCTKTKAVCTTHRLWEALSDHVFYFLRHTSLADLASTHFPAIIRTPCNDTVETRSNQFIYLDYNATAPLLPQVKTSMVEILDLDGNPSSVHGLGRALRAKIDKARKQVAAAPRLEPCPLKLLLPAGEQRRII